jgi:mannitol-specific phosphotransferase system IIBC component
MLKFLFGILIVQVATVAMTLAAMKAGDREIWMAVILLATFIGLVTSFWFASIASHMRKDALTKAKDNFSKEREKIRVNAERQKTRLLKKSHEDIRKETNRAHAKTNFKLGAGFIGIVGAGALMIFSQFLTLGLLTLATGGGALGGYLMRVRHEGSSRRKVAAAGSGNRKPVIEINPLKDDTTST